MQFFLIFCVAFAATFLGSISGGSASLIAIPCWLSLGFSLPVAVACDKLAATFWTALACRNYLRKQSIEWSLLSAMGVLGLIGVYAGAQVTTHIASKQLKPVVGIIIIVLVGLTLIKKEFGLHPATAKLSKSLSASFGLLLGFYEGFFGSGNSIFTAYILCKARGYNLLVSLGHYYFLACLWCAFAAVVYIYSGFYAIPLMLPAVIGSVAGGYVGSHLGARQGAQFVKTIFVLVGLTFGFKLLLGF